VPQPAIRPFDVSALHQALDSRRSQLGLSWAGVASEIWATSSALNDRRKDHPISPSTLTNMAKQQRTSCQHALFMLRWLGRSPESFLQGADGDDQRFALPDAGTDRRLRWSLSLLYTGMDGTRRDQGLAWAALASILGCTQNQLTGLRTARFAADMDVAMRIVQWLDRPASEFIYPATW
jgi:hypothetical protein